jgi:hypothetical protein
MKQVIIDLHGENVTTPAVLKTLGSILKPLLLVFGLVKHYHRLSPG